MLIRPTLRNPGTGLVPWTRSKSSVLCSVLRRWACDIRHWVGMQVRPPLVSLREQVCCAVSSPTALDLIKADWCKHRRPTRMEQFAEVKAPLSQWQILMHNPPLGNETDNRPLIPVLTTVGCTGLDIALELECRFQSRHRPIAPGVGPALRNRFTLTSHSRRLALPTLQTRSSRFVKCTR